MKRKQEIENLFEKHNERELSQSGKGNRLLGSPGISDSPKEVGPKEAHTKAYHNYITQNYIDKERILKATREKERVTYKGVPVRLSADFSKEILQTRRCWEKVFRVMEGKDLHPRLLYPAKLSSRINRRADKVLPR